MRPPRWSATLCTWLCACLSVASVAVAAEPVCAKPSSDADGWAVAANAQDAGFDAAALCAALGGASEPVANPSNTHAVLVERGGKLVAERYFLGRDKPLGDWFQREKEFGPADLHDVRSISKSVVALLVGIARERGKLAPLDTPVLDYFPEYHDLDTPERRAITLEHLLTMTPGLAWDESGSGFRLGNNETRMSLARDRDRYVLERPIAGPPGARWVYNGGTTTLLADALERVTGTPLERYARDVLFTPLGITQLEWRAEFRDKASPYSGLRLRPRDMAKIGRLMLDEGQWNGQQVVPADWVRASMKAHVAAEDELTYGYQWWSGTVQHAGRALAWNAGVGNGGQRLFIVPELDLVVVITAGRYGEPNNGRPSMALFRQIVAAAKP